MPLPALLSGRGIAINVLFPNYPKCLDLVLIYLSDLMISIAPSPDLVDTAKDLYDKRVGGAYGAEESSFQP